MRIDGLLQRMIGGGIVSQEKESMSCERISVLDE